MNGPKNWMCLPQAVTLRSVTISLEKFFNRLKEVQWSNVSDVFDAWAIAGKDEEFESSNKRCKYFLKNEISFPNEPFSFLELGCSSGWMLR